ncbi:serine racemase VanT catalytic subunit [Paenibacillus montanisoli]|uniref:Alanine racemase n=1 Tax=Paenibacillus montanisoli TaxID=2081970 RepID=A0A328U4U1_9BACL|nr:serine racemase VanT catalytic subunit [Paenibacillus montanisoli]RAP74906.1 serine racemase VanT catalytic subunit [Paenibacillus montanisoli]
MAADRSYGWIDLVKLAAAVLVIANHTGPLTSWSEEADFVLTNIISRLAVPFFFMASGFFLFRAAKEGIRNKPSLRKFMVRIGGLYALGILLYLPVNVYAGHFGPDSTAGAILKEIAFGGTFYHLWYLPALLLGTAIVYMLRLRLQDRTVLVVTGALYAIGMFGDSYYGVAARVDALAVFYAQLFDAFGQTRNGLFFAPFFIALGAFIGNAASNTASRRSARWYGGMFLISFSLLLAEGTALHRLGLQLHEVMYVALVPAAYALFRLLTVRSVRGHRRVRYMSTAVYLLHPLAIVLVRGAAKLLGIQTVVIGNSFAFFAAVTIASLLPAAMLAIISVPRSSPMPGNPRAWVQIDLSNLDHNARVLKQALPDGTSLMAVVKANAYGHGSVGIAKRLQRGGIRQFAVAEVGEAVELRKAGVKGDILILGYTPTERLNELIWYNITQTVIHADDAQRLQAHGGKFKVHVKIDTGMNRLGEQFDRQEELLSMYRHSRLQVTGTYSHLAEADSLDPYDIAFSRKQIDRFRHAVDLILAAGFNPGRLHLQSSYGILNFPDLEMDLARPGIALYGLLSTEGGATRTKIDLRPVLSLKASVSRVHLVKSGEFVGYGRSFAAAADTMVATVAIGYADGIPRELSGRGGSVLIHGRRAPIIGRICMDQLTVDVSGIPDVRQGDIATIIGEDGAERITAGEIAMRTGTITNEIVCSMGTRAAKRFVSEPERRPAAKTLAGAGIHAPQ